MAGRFSGRAVCRNVRELIGSILRLMCRSRKSLLTFRFQEFDDLFTHRLIANSLVGLHIVA